MQRLCFAASSVAAALWLGAACAQPGEPLEEIVVTADFREQSIAELPLSVTVLDSDELESSSLQHFEEMILRVPNLNYSGEGSRARYLQLRGIGELEQYEGAPNPSVGMIVDDIDFSGLGSIGTLFDVERVEVLRGPQGTRYGSNALGGLVYMRSMQPTEEFSADFEATAGNDDTWALGAAVGGPLKPSLGYRFSVHQYQSNGFRRNAFLDRDDTYGRDELSTRGKLRWSPSDRVTVDVTGLYVDVDNGYDAWTIDNGFTTQSDRPGRDAQRSVAGSVRVAAELERFDLVSISGLAETDAVYSFDADWGNAAFWSPFVYDYVTRNDRERDTFNQEVRLLSKEDALAGRGQWLLGVYMLDLEESNDSSSMGVYDDGVFCDPCTLDQRVTSGYDARNVALFGQLDFPLGERAELTAGLRWERRSADYADTSGNRFDPDDRMVGGELGIAWQLSGPLRPYLRVARGYKAGGFNVAFAGVDFDDVETVAPEQIEFDAESLWSFEAGARGRWLDGRITADVNAFLVRRDDQQIRIPLQLFPGDPSSFLFLTENADRSEHSGIEADVEWQAQDRLRLFASLGLLSTEIERFAFFPELEGREQAHAPDYTYTLGAEYRGPAGWWGRFDVNGADAFYFDYSHGQKSKRYTVGNLRVGREWGPWGVTLWARNLFDEEYFVRGFFFGNEPPDFADRLYTRLGDPRHYGVTLNYRL